jgi:predicted metal-binding transcription factor (methanogenesis marker protein 9)
MEKTVEILSKLEHDPIHELMNLKKKLNEGSITSDEFKEKTVEILSKK